MKVQGEHLDWSHLEHWCGQHGTLDILAEAKAKAKAASAWEDTSSTYHLSL